jgi:hypothetical protein
MAQGRKIFLVEQKVNKSDQKVAPDSMVFPDNLKSKKTGMDKNFFG